MPGIRRALVPGSPARTTRSQLKEFVAADTPVESAAERSKLSSCRNHGAGPNAVPRAGRPRGCSDEEKSKPRNGLGENFTLAQAEFDRRTVSVPSHLADLVDKPVNYRRIKPSYNGQNIK
jgi:hypothetical protein